MQQYIKKYDNIRKCQCGTDKIQYVLLNNKLPENQRLQCLKCNQNYEGDDVFITYKCALKELHEKKAKRENIRKNIIENQKKPIEKLIQLLDSTLQDFTSEFNSVKNSANEWLRILNELQEMQNQKICQDEIYSIRQKNLLDDQKETLQFLHQIKSCNFQFCNKILKKIQNIQNCQKKISKSYQLLFDSLFEIEPSFETSQADLIKICQNKQCTLHQQPIIKASYNDPNKPLGEACQNCEKIEGESLETFVNHWANYLMNLKQSFIQRNLIFKEKIIQHNNSQVSNQEKINSYFNQTMQNLFFTVGNELSSQCLRIEELKNLELDANILRMCTVLVSKEDYKIQHKESNSQVNQNQSMGSILNQINFIIEQQNLAFQHSSQTNQRLKIGMINILDPTRHGPIEFKYLSQHQNENCSVIEFNPTKKLIITNQGGRIYLYQFNNQIQKFMKVNSKSNHGLPFLTGLIHSKVSNYIVTADEKLVLWKYNDQEEDFKQLADSRSNGYINCLLINQKETQLLSGSTEIQVYYLNFEQSQLKFEYSLNEHQGKILSLRFNDSETYLISSCERKQIIIWYKKEGRWHLMQSIDLCECANRVFFIRDNLFITVFSQIKNDIVIDTICFYQNFDNFFKEQTPLQIVIECKELEQKNQLDKPGFPIIQLKSHNLILQWIFNYNLSVVLFIF